MDKNANKDLYLCRNHDNKRQTLLLAVVVDSIAAADLQLAVAEWVARQCFEVVRLGPLADFVESEVVGLLVGQLLVWAGRQDYYD